MLISLSKQDYKTAFSILAKSSQHYQTVLELFSQHIQATLPGQANYLDIGPGDGVITRQLLSHFTHTTIIEPNELMVSEWYEKDIAWHNITFLECELDGKYDFILCSHVLYKMSQAEISKFIGKILQHLKPGGSCLLAFIAPRGKNHELHSAFNPDYPNSNFVIHALEQHSVDYTKIAAVNDFTVGSYADALTIVKFFVYEDCITPDILADHTEAQKAELMDKIETFVACTKNGSHYPLQQEEDYFIFTKRY